jgi:hypothetical protein
MTDAEFSTGPSLTVVGTGLKFRQQLTPESREAIEQAERLLFVTADILTATWLRELNSQAEHMPRYLEGRPRRETYELWVELVLEALRGGQRTTAVTYGHPGGLVRCAREAIRRARAPGIPARMLPGISAEACLIADLVVDPGEEGWQSYTANRFLDRRPRFDTGTPLVVWQLRVIDHAGPPRDIERAGLERLQAFLLDHYPSEHQVFVYEGSRNEIIDPVIQDLPLSALSRVRFRQSATLYVPPLVAAVPGVDGD